MTEADANWLASGPGPEVPRSPVVLKVGGAIAGVEAERLAFGRYVAGLFGAGGAVVVVHGGGEEVARLQRAGADRADSADGAARADGTDKADRADRVGGSAGGTIPRRATSPEAMKRIAMTLCGHVNLQLVATLVAVGVPALGLSGVDLALLRSQLLNELKLGRVGGPPRVDARRIEALLGAGLVPVLAPVCLGPDGRALRVNPDTVAHTVAVALSARCLDFVSEAPGVRTVRGRRIDRLARVQAAALLEEGQVLGSMIPKLQAALAALASGVQQVRIGTLQSLAAGTATEVTASGART